MATLASSIGITRRWPMWPRGCLLFILLVLGFSRRFLRDYLVFLQPELWILVLALGMKNVPIIHSHDSIQSLSKNISKAEREHDLVIASYVLGEIPSIKVRITTVRQLWDLTGDVLVLVEPGTPHGFKIILWIEKRLRKSKLSPYSKELMALKNGVFIVAPCPHDGPCQLEKTGKIATLCNDWKGHLLSVRTRGSWPFDGMQFETLKEQHAKRNLEDVEIDLEGLIRMQEERDKARLKELDTVSYDSDIIETDNGDGDTDSEGDRDGEGDDEEDSVRADLGGGWGRIIFTPVRRGRQVALDVCRSTERNGSKGAFEHVVVTRSNASSSSKI